MGITLQTKTKVCLVGSKRFNVFGNHGSVNYVSLKHFDCLKDVRAYLKDEERQCTIYGVEIIEGAKPIQEHPFEGNAAFILGNEVGRQPRRSFFRSLFFFFQSFIFPFVAFSSCLRVTDVAENKPTRAKA